MKDLQGYPLSSGISGMKSLHQYERRSLDTLTFFLLLLPTSCPTTDTLWTPRPKSAPFPKRPLSHPLSPWALGLWLAQLCREPCCHKRLGWQPLTLHNVPLTGHRATSWVTSLQQAAPGEAECPRHLHYLPNPSLTHHLPIKSPNLPPSYCPEK